MLRKIKEIYLTIFLILLVILLIVVSIEKEKLPRIEQPVGVYYEQDVIDLGSLTLKQKIAQMILSYGKEENKEELQKLNIGGIFLGAKGSRSEYMAAINDFQNGSIIPFLVAIDMEGCVNPFENFQDFPSLKEINNKKEAYEVGKAEGELMKELGFTINFAPVVDLNDTVWKCRSFLGTPEEIASKASSYIIGLQEDGIIATAKHYPGKTLMRDPHKKIVYANVDEDDILPFNEAIKYGVGAIMVSHIIVNGSVNSENKPSSVSEKLIGNLRNNFDGLIITDEIRMNGLEIYYKDRYQMYIDLFKADNDIILNLDNNIKNLHYVISVVERAVNEGIISEERIDRSIERILKAKGIRVVK